MNWWISFKESEPLSLPSNLKSPDCSRPINRNDRLILLLFAYSTAFVITIRLSFKSIPTTEPRFQSPPPLVRVLFYALVWRLIRKFANGTIFESEQIWENSSLLSPKIGNNMMKHPPAHPALINYIFHCLSSGKMLSESENRFTIKCVTMWLLCSHSSWMNEQTN